MSVKIIRKSQDAVGATDCESDRNGKQKYCEPQGADLDPWTEKGGSEVVVFLTTDDGITPVCEQHPGVETGKDHYCLKN